MLNIQIGSATAVMLEAIPETTCPSQIMKRPLIPFGRRKGKFNFHIAVSISQRLRENNPQPRLFSCKVVSNTGSFFRLNFQRQLVPSYHDPAGSLRRVGSGG